MTYISWVKFKQESPEQPVYIRANYGAMRQDFVDYHCSFKTLKAEMHIKIGTQHSYHPWNRRDLKSQINSKNIGTALLDKSWAR